MYAPAPVVTDAIMQQVVAEVLQPAIAAMKEGCLTEAAIRRLND